MIVRLVSVSCRIIAWAFFGAAFIFPLAALLHSCITAPGAAAEFAVSMRQWGLLWRSCWLSGAAAVFAIVLAMPAAVVLAQARRLADCPVLVAVLFAMLLCPPMVYSFGWDRLLPPTVDGRLRCMGVWAGWAWPIPAMLIAVGWSRGGRMGYEAALLCTSPARALLVATRPVLQRYVLLSAVLLFLVFFGDYGVPHACGLMVYATELLAWASTSQHALGTVAPALPGVLLFALLLAIVAALWRRCTLVEVDDSESIRRVSPFMSGLAWLIIMVGCLLPFGVLTSKLSSWRILVDAVGIYRDDLLWSLAVCGGAGLVCAVMGWGLAGPAALFRAGVGVTVWFGALPGALMGVALVSAYHRTGFAWAYDHWPVVLLSYVGHFGWVAMLAVATGGRWQKSELAEQARVDGASAAEFLDHVVFPIHAPVLLAAAGIVTTLSLSDVAACSLVRVPGYTPVAHVIIEKFHRFEDDMLISLSLILVGAAFLAAFIAVWALGRRIRPPT